MRKLVILIMNIYKRLPLVLIFVVLILVTSVNLTNLKGYSIETAEHASPFHGLSGSLRYIDLMIYVPHSNIHSLPIVEADLKEMSFRYRIIVRGNRIGHRNHRELIYTLSEFIPIPVESTSSHVDIKLHYLFKSRTGDRLVDVAICRINNRTFVNGHEVETNDIFFDVIMPFLPISLTACESNAFEERMS